MDEVTQKTLSRIFTRELTERFTPVGGQTGYPQCENETVLFSITPDQQSITLKNFRPGVSAKGLDDGAKPTQTSVYEVRKAYSKDGVDYMVLRPDPRPITGPSFQLWEVRDGVIRISLMEKEDSSELIKGSYLSMCRS